jgi:hypothetical protein
MPRLARLVVPVVVPWEIRCLWTAWNESQVVSYAHRSQAAHRSCPNTHNRFMAQESAPRGGSDGLIRNVFPAAAYIHIQITPQEPSVCTN